MGMVKNNGSRYCAMIIENLLEALKCDGKLRAKGLLNVYLMWY